MSIPLPRGWQPRALPLSYTCSLNPAFSSHTRHMGTGSGTRYKPRIDSFAKNASRRRLTEMPRNDMRLENNGVELTCLAMGDQPMTCLLIGDQPNASAATAMGTAPMTPLGAEDGTRTRNVMLGRHELYH